MESGKHRIAFGLRSLLTIEVFFALRFQRWKHGPPPRPIEFRGSPCHWRFVHVGRLDRCAEIRLGLVASRGDIIAPVGASLLANEASFASKLAPTGQ